MTNIAVHVRIFDPDPSDDLVAKRTTAIEEIAAAFGSSRPVEETFATANGLANAVGNNSVLAESIRTLVESAISKEAVAFVADGNSLQMTVCGLLGALQSLEDSEPDGSSLETNEVLAIGLWCALSFQPPRSEPKLETLRMELLKAAQKLTAEAATISRQRMAVPEVKIGVKAVDAASISEAINVAVAPAFAALRSNAAMDREEIDFLWWLLADWSELLVRKFSDAGSPVVAAIASGLEAGKMLRGMPSAAHLHLVLRNVDRSAEPYDLPGLIKAIATERERLAASYKDNPFVTANPAIFPLLTALLPGQVSCTSAAVKRSLTEWASRALLESAAAHIVNQLPRGL